MKFVNQELRSGTMRFPPDVYPPRLSCANMVGWDKQVRRTRNRHMLEHLRFQRTMIRRFHRYWNTELICIKICHLICS